MFVPSSLSRMAAAWWWGQESQLSLQKPIDDELLNVLEQRCSDSIQKKASYWSFCHCRQECQPLDEDGRHPKFFCRIQSRISGRRCWKRATVIPCRKSQVIDIFVIAGKNASHLMRRADIPELFAESSLKWMKEGVETKPQWFHAENHKLLKFLSLPARMPAAWWGWQTSQVFLQNPV